jgi:hypothetical protein
MSRATQSTVSSPIGEIVAANHRGCPRMSSRYSHSTGPRVSMARRMYAMNSALASAENTSSSRRPSRSAGSRKSSSVALGAIFR